MAVWMWHYTRKTCHSFNPVNGSETLWKERINPGHQSTSSFATYPINLILYFAKRELLIWNSTTNNTKPPGNGLLRRLALYRPIGICVGSHLLPNYFNILTRPWSHLRAQWRGTTPHCLQNSRQSEFQNFCLNCLIGWPSAVQKLKWSLLYWKTLLEIWKCATTEK